MGSSHTFLLWHLWPLSLPPMPWRCPKEPPTHLAPNRGAKDTLWKSMGVGGDLLKKNGVWLAMKSQTLETEKAALDAPLVFVEQRMLQVPGLNEVRQLAVLKFAEATT